MKVNGTAVEINTKQQLTYQEFLRVAWGKAVRIQSAEKGEVIYRLSQSAAVLPYTNVATPRSPIGRLVSIARAGDQFEHDELGECEIKDVWYFERYVGHEFIDKIKNFRVMISTGVNEFKITNLIAWNEDFLAAKELPSTPLHETERQEGWGKVIFEDFEQVHSSTVSPISLSDEDKGISLPEKFYVNLTKQQYDASHWGEYGLMLVSGVAGSGKTSVALARAKSLAQLGQIDPNEDLFNSDFSEETQLGVVRTGELINYLKGTCEMLSLHRLPIVEFREMVEELKFHWNLELVARSGSTKFRYQLSENSEQEDLEVDSNMEYFSLVSDKMVALFLDEVLTELEKTKFTKITNIDGDFLTKVNNVVIKELTKFQSHNSKLHR